jgi:hypothetical protein
MSKKQTDNASAKRAPEALSGPVKHEAPRVESKPDLELSKFFRANGMPNVASLIEDLEQRPAR